MKLDNRIKYDMIHSRVFYPLPKSGVVKLCKTSKAYPWGKGTTMSIQAKNTINDGDALRDYLDRAVAKKRVAGVWNGAKESDMTVRPDDCAISAKTALRVLGLPISGKIRIGWRLANVYEGKTASLDSLPAPDLDWFVHFRPDGDNIVALAIPREKILAYWQNYGREIARRDQATTQIQLNTPAATLPKVGSKKWHELMSFVAHTAIADKAFTKAEQILAKVNEAGRDEATTNASNPRHNERKVGEPYKAR